jgi:D-beta-D-heptose 7-phosphate kinase / D-beta-D-heptose 1-phosphate adenosyltransferase
MNSHSILKCLNNLRDCRIAVVGDLMLDEYLWGHIERISPEAPVPILSIVHRECMLGGAGNVVQNLRTLGVEVAVLGVIGEDETGHSIRYLLNEHGADVSGVIPDAGRKSTRKIRLMSLEHGQQVFRIDEETTESVGENVEDQLVRRIHNVSEQAQVIVCSDYRKGVLTDRVLDAAFTAARERGIGTIVAPKETKAEKYRGASILVPNTRELSQLVDTPVDGEVWLSDSGQRLMQTIGLEALLVTRGRDGMSLFEKSKAGVRRVDIPTVARSVYDVTGAGDTAIAAFAAAVASGMNREDAAHLANFAAGIKVAKRGTACVSLPEIMECIREQGCGGRDLESQTWSQKLRPAVKDSKNERTVRI